MATTLTLDVVRFFAAGTSLGAYRFYSEDPDGVTPPVAATSTASVASDGTVSFTGLTDNTQYWIGTGNTPWRFLSATTTPAATSGGTGASLTQRTAVKSGAYTAAAGDLVPVDVTAGSVTITLPTAPASKTQVAVKRILPTTVTTNIVTILCGGADTINRTGGPTSTTLTIAGQSAVFQYDATSATWTIVAVDLALSQLDLRYAGYPRVVAGGSLGATPSLALVATDTDPIYTGTLTANATLTITGLVAGQSLRLLLTQDTTGGRSFSITVGGSTAAVAINNGASAYTVCTAIYDGTDLYVKGA